MLKCRACPAPGPRLESEPASPLPQIHRQIKNDKKKKSQNPSCCSLLCCTSQHNRKWAVTGLCVSACAWMRLVRTAGSEECACAKVLVSVFVYVWVMLARAVNTFKQFITPAVGKPFANQRKGPLIRIKSQGEPAVETQPLSDTHQHTKVPTHLFIPSRWSEVMKPASCCSQRHNENCFAWSLP